MGGGGLPGMSYSFGCKATDWLLGIWSSCKDFALGVSVVILDGASVVQILKGVGASTVQAAVYKRCFKTLRYIHFL